MSQINQNMTSLINYPPVPSQIYVVQQVSEDLNKMSRQQLIEQVQRQKQDNLKLKEKLKYTQSFIIEPSTGKNTKQDKSYKSTHQIKRIEMERKQKQRKESRQRKPSQQRKQKKDVLLIGEANILRYQNKNIIPVSAKQQIHQKPTRSPGIFANHHQEKIIPHMAVKNIQGSNNLQIPQSNTNHPQMYQQHHVIKPIRHISYCAKHHILHFLKTSGLVSCSKCSNNCKSFCWGCMGCQYYECLKCKSHPKSHCPYNDPLNYASALHVDTSNLKCGICEGALKGNSLCCVSCSYHICGKCSE